MLLRTWFHELMALLSTSCLRRSPIQGRTLQEFIEEPNYVAFDEKYAQNRLDSLQLWDILHMKVVNHLHQTVNPDCTLLSNCPR